MNYELYHDESKRNGYWHGIYLVPSETKTKLYDLLEKARDYQGYKNVIGIKEVRKKNSKKYFLANAWINIGVASLLQAFKGRRYISFLGRVEKGKMKYDIFNDLLKCKFILFREKDDHKYMNMMPDYGSKIETTFRFGVKGGMNFLGNTKNPINIVRLHFDGHAHYGRRVDINRVKQRITGLKEFCSIEDKNDLIDDRTGNHTQDDSQEYIDCQILQLTDLLVGGFRTFLGECTREIHKELNYPIKNLINSYREGYSRMRNSRWFNGYCMSECWLENNQWRFEGLDYSSQKDNDQYSLLL